MVFVLECEQISMHACYPNLELLLDSTGWEGGEKSAVDADCLPRSKIFATSKLSVKISAHFSAAVS